MARATKGFSMVEVMVVLAILMTLIALLLPAFHGAKQAADAVVCRSALHQQGLGFNGYLADHRGVFPDHRLSPGRHGNGHKEKWWAATIAPYVGPQIDDPKTQSFYHCASIGNPQVDYGIAWTWDFCQHHIGYGYNGWFLGIRLYRDQAWGVFRTHGGRRFTEVVNPAQNMVVADSTIKASGKWAQSLWWPFSDEDGNHEGVSGRHNEGANILFNDGHVAWYHKLDVNPATDPYWDPRSTRFWDPLQRIPEPR